MMKDFNLEEVRRRTFMQNSRLQDLTKFVTDPDKEKRLSEQLCICCYYSNIMAGQALTDSSCISCSAVMHFSSTKTDSLCQPCATKHRLCKDCGADIEYKKRNKL